jgi:hypothetical protein
LNDTFDDRAIPLRPEMISFSPIKVGDEHLLRMVIHTDNLGAFILPSTATPKCWPTPCSGIASRWKSTRPSTCERAALHIVRSLNPVS